MRLTHLVTVVSLLVGPAIAVGAGFDERMAQRTLKQNKCFNCHSVTREKDGPSYQKVAEKYKEHPDARHVLFDHLTKSPTIKVNGKEEAHTAFKTDDAAEINNVIEWILSN